MHDNEDTYLDRTSNAVYSSLGEFFSSPIISGLCQVNPISAGIASYIGGSYQQYRYKTLEDFLYLLDVNLKSVEEKYIDKAFIESPEGQRIIGKVFRAIQNDNRKEKLEAMANLTTNIYTVFTSRKVSFDEKELYVGILDGLNSLQLSILQKAMEDIKARVSNQHRGFGWEIMGEHYERKGITRALLLQSISVLESNGIVNKNTATISENDKTHFITFFGEQFYAFISHVISNEDEN